MEILFYMLVWFFLSIIPFVIWAAAVELFRYIMNKLRSKDGQE